ncbi:glycoside hydrolase family 16 protein [Robiginitalea sediminis]|uniref:glycoside hydrolase family 16 protein n=1 Tax=Robiginitalea sediminis TaxID=1982593 RepID=UPI000B4BD508|nr:glycoside hydrolase family 16 protein [Robiginitalea sediminis]
MKTVKNTTLLLLSSLLLLAGCRNEQDTTEDEMGLLPQPELPNPQDPDYWDAATLVWSDEFDGTSLDPDKWTFETGDHGWGNNEWQNYVTQGVTEVSDGTLKITARKVGTGGHVGDYESARLNSREAFTFGRLEIRAKIPEWKGKGIWPALWMLGSNIGQVGWPECGEIDMMEYVSYDPGKVHFSIHSPANNHKDGTQVTSGPVPLETIEEEFHNYGILWTDQYIKFYLDDPSQVTLVFPRPTPTTAENWPFSKPFYFLMNIAVGGDWGGLQGVEDTIFPAVMEVDYVRVYQVPPPGQ